ncbi:MAG TPA: hypothetical protein VF852_02960 [Pseudolabrys sp.]
MQKTEEELAKENAALRKQIRRLELEVQNAKLRDRVDRLNTQIETAAAPTNAEIAAQPKANVNTKVWTGSAAKISPAAANAYAADLPVKEPPKGVAVGASGFYTWLDGSYQRINLPNYGLGFMHADIGAATVSGPIHSFDAHAAGYGIAGGVGYLLPYAPTSPWFGSDMRVEVAGSYINATATQTAGASITAPGPGSDTGVVLLNGQASTLLGCLTPSICQTNAALHTDYSSWQVGGRLASDYRFGLVTLTPSLGLFAGSSKNDQTFAESLTVLGGPITLFYNASTALRWTDLGGRLGLDGKLAVHPWVTLGLGGWVGWAGRWTDFNGTDRWNSATPPPAFGSSVTASDTTTAFLANLEASVTVTPTPHWTGRAFVGLNYDDSVPGISTPTASGQAFAPTSVTRAGIVYAKETSWYAGGGVAYRFY